MNPYKMLPIYDQKALEAYNQYGVASPGPHVFGVAASTYRGLLDAVSTALTQRGPTRSERGAERRSSLAYAAFAIRHHLRRVGSW